MENLKKNEIIYLGNLRNKPMGFVGTVLDGGGICPTLLARDYKDAKLVLVNEIQIRKERRCEKA